MAATLGFTALRRPVGGLLLAVSMAVFGLALGGVVELGSGSADSDRLAGAIAMPDDPPPSASGSRTAWACARATECAEVTWAAGVLQVDDQRFTLGTAVDEVVVGDWTCSGVPAPALLRTADRTVWAFDRWAEPGADVTGRLIGLLPAGAALFAPAPCGPPLALSADGRLPLLQPTSVTTSVTSP